MGKIGKEFQFGTRLFQNLLLFQMFQLQAVFHTEKVNGPNNQSAA